jgi:membrane protein YqaA with SNARE-associated domain
LSQADIEKPIKDPSNAAADNKRTAHSKANRMRYIRSALALLVALVVSAAVLVIGNRIERFEHYGYPGIFLLNLLSSATIVVPAPGLAAVSMMGSVLNPWLVGLCAGAGDALGELTGYLAGYSGRAVIEDQNRYEKVARWTKQYGLWVILVLSIVPNPLFDLAGIAAGALKVPLSRFLLICWIGKTVKTTLFALGGQTLLRLLPFVTR